MLEVGIHDAYVLAAGYLEAIEHGGGQAAPLSVSLAMNHAYA